MSNVDTFPRVIIKGTLTTKSLSHFGATVLLSNTAFNAAQYIEHNNAQPQPCCSDINDNPYLPSSTSRGLLSSWLRERMTDDEELQAVFGRLFGYARGGDDAQAGVLRVYDAIVSAQSPKIELQQLNRIAIDPILGIAQEKKLFAVQAIPEGTVFNFHCEADHISQTEIALLLGLLTRFDGSELSSAGKGGSQYWGRLQWTLDTVSVLTKAELQQWLLNDDISQTAFVPLANHIKPLTAITPDTGPFATRCCIKYEIRPQSPLLINRLTDKPGKNEPDVEFMRDNDGRLVVPSSTLRGLVRGHCRKILLTMLSRGEPVTKQHNDVADQLLNEAFGSTAGKSRVWMKDAVSDQAADKHKQMFNAVDRFTGGVADGALYCAEAGWAQRLSSELSIDTDWWQSADWFQGLMLFLLRDAMEGDLRLGWGKNKGFGAIKIILPVQAGGTDNIRGACIDSWFGLLEQLKQHEAEGGVQRRIQALTDKLDALLTAQGG